MPMRLSGLMSGMDTESIVAQLVEAKKTKVTKAVKAQKSLKYKQDAWKDLNKKIVNLYNKSIGNMRFESSFIKKTTKVSNSSVVSVITGEGAMNSVQNLQVKRLASTGFLTGGKLPETVTEKDENGKDQQVGVTGKTTLGQLGLNLADGEKGSLTLETKGKDGKSTTITVDNSTTLDSFLGALRNAGLNANLDEVNHRIYIAAKNSGSDNDFSIKANDLNGMKALKSMGLDYDDTDENGNSAFKSYYQSIIDERSKQEYVDKRLASQLSSLVSRKSASQSNLGNVLQKLDVSILDAIKGKLSGSAFTQKVTAEDGSEITLSIGDEGFDYTKLGKKDMEALNTAFGDVVNDDLLTDAQDKLTQAQNALANADASDADAYAAAEQAVVDAEAAVANAEKALGSVQTWTSNWNNLEEVYGKLDVDASGELTTDGSGNFQLSSGETTAVTNAVAAEVQAAQDVLTELENKSDSGSFSATKSVGEDAHIKLNGVDYYSSKNTFEINNLTLTVSAKTAENETVTITTEDDTNGIYDMIKSFIKEYSALINEMDKLYNADSAKDYEPLTDEEKESMSDSQIEEWETKIKDSILRKDGTLGNFANTLKRIMMEGVEVNGKEIYLSNFGIGTLSYFTAAENEKSAYHIDGDPDDENTSGNPDKLKSMIANDPDTVVSFFTQLSQKLYSKMFDMMKSVDGVSSSMTAYEDKKMQSEYDDYTTKIKELEKKLADYEDKWYAKFAAMETALAKMQNNASAVTSLLGG